MTTPTIIAIIIILLLIPQVYYMKKAIDYRAINNGVKFFIRIQREFDDHKEFYLANTDGHNIFVRLYEVENPKAIIQLVHGMAEHSYNYKHFIKFLVSQGYTVVAHDHRGHGRSISEKYPNGYMSLSEELIDDTYAVNRFVSVRYPELKIFMVGHSMGSMIARNYLKDHDNTIDKLILTGTVAHSKFAHFGKFMGNFISFYFGEYKKARLTALLPGGDGDIGWISYDRENVIEKQNDPQRVFNFLEKAVTVIIDLNYKMGKRKSYRSQNKDLAILSITGVDDIVTDGEKGLAGSFDNLSKVGYHDLTNIVYDGMKHEVLNEASKEVVYEDIIEFLEK